LQGSLNTSLSHHPIFGFGKVSKLPTSLGFWFWVSFKAFNVPWFLAFGKFQRSQSFLILGLNVSKVAIFFCFMVNFFGFKFSRSKSDFGF